MVKQEVVAVVLGHVPCKPNEIHYTAVSESLLDPDDEREDVDPDSVEASSEDEAFESLSQLSDEVLDS